MSKEFRERLHLPVAETLHLVHTMMEMVQALLAGTRASFSRQILQAVELGGARHKIHCVARIEFQDGTHKEATQPYHGSGRPHIHVLLFWDDAAWPLLDLQKHLSAAMPSAADPTRGYVEGSQLDARFRSGWPVDDGPEGWDAELGRFRLRHPAEDADAGLRPYFVAIMDVLKCHQDVQIARDEGGILRAYVAKYVSKFSDSAQNEWLNDRAEPNSIAATVLSRYKPCEPEMVLQLFGGRFRQWRLTTHSRGRRWFAPPVPDAERMPEEVETYLAATWARGRIPLIDFLRKTTKAGDICAWLKKLHEASGSDDDLREFARQYRMRGEKVVAAEFVSRLNDRFYGQWLMLFVPFDRPEDLYDSAIVQKVPRQMRYFAMATLSPRPVAQQLWSSPAAIARDMEVEGHTREHIQTVQNMVRAQRSLIDDYVAGRLDAHAERRQREETQRRHGQQRQDAVQHWNTQQQTLIDRVSRHVDDATVVQRGDSEEGADRVRERLWASGRAVACFGPPGTGKTTAVFHCIQHALDAGGKVLFALPTAQLASRMREKWGDAIDVDTCAAAFGFMENKDFPMNTLSFYALVIIDEISQLEGWQSDHVLKMWDAADQVPAVVFAGDKWQMAGFGDERPWHTRTWKKRVRAVELREVYRCRDPEFREVLDALRTAVPSERFVNKLARERVAWRGCRPTVDEVRKLLKSKPHTTILTCTRRGAQAVNDRAVEALFPRFPPKATLDADVESSPANYRGGKLKVSDELVPSQLPIYIGMRVYLTRNVRKDVDFVNGMLATVQSYNRASRELRVLTRTGFAVSVFPWTDTDLGNVTYYPVRAGYASTILKFQGAELRHVTVFLDAPGVPGAAYTAMSRVGHAEDCVLAGPLAAEHFTPAR